MRSVFDTEGEILGEVGQEGMRGAEGASPNVLGAGGGGSGKQPNFLQKLYDFMALDPHPCPDVIYWAADSKQLVVAQPERLAKEVLPKLFKHDKLSSFGRQLNIYGFSRMFPGRQFKGPDGSISDASVWSHPTLHRSSTLTDVASIKRRAAPKLFRTRRLANGQVIRTRAGPGVQAKFHEVRDEMAETRRSRVGGASGDPRATRSYAFEDNEGTDGESPRQRSVSLRVSPSDLSQSPHHVTQRVAPHRSIVPEQRQQVSPTRTQFWDRGREQVDPQAQIGQSAVQQPQAHSLALECIQEGIASSWGSSFDFPPIHSLPLNSPLYRQGTSSFSAATPYIPYTAQGTAHACDNIITHQLSQIAPTQLSTMSAGPMTVGMAIQSCPASIHTSPVLRHASISQANHVPHDPFDLIPSLTPTPLFGTHHQHHQLPPIITTQPTEYALHSAPPPFRITEPAAIDPFGFDISPIHAQSQPMSATHAHHHRDSVASALSAISNLSTPSSMSDQQSVSVLGWRGDTINPRWISPVGSVWNTPTATPRSGSPIDGHSSRDGAGVAQGLIMPNTYHL